MSEGLATRFTGPGARGLAVIVRAPRAGLGCGRGCARKADPGAWLAGTPRGAAAGRALCAIVWAGAPGAVVVCSRAELCAAPAPWSPAAAGIGRSSSVAQCSGNGGGEEHFTLILGLPRLPQPLTCTFLPQFPISAAPAWVSQLPFSPSGTVSGLGIVRSSGTGRGNHSLMLGADLLLLSPTP